MITITLYGMCTGRHILDIICNTILAPTATMQLPPGHNKFLQGAHIKATMVLLQFVVFVSSWHRWHKAQHSRIRSRPVQSLESEGEITAMAFLQLVLLLCGNIHPWSSHGHSLCTRQRRLDMGIWHSSLNNDTCYSEFLRWIAILPLHASCRKSIHSDCTGCCSFISETKPCVTW